MLGLLSCVSGSNSEIALSSSDGSGCYLFTVERVNHTQSVKTLNLQLNHHMNALNTSCIYIIFVRECVHKLDSKDVHVQWYHLQSPSLIIELIVLLFIWEFAFIIKYPRFSDISSSFLINIKDCTAVDRSEQLLHSEQVCS